MPIKIGALMNQLNKEERKLLLELIGNEQIHMIIKDHTKYDSEKYKMLESLKIKVKDIKGEEISEK